MTTPSGKRQWFSTNVFKISSSLEGVASSRSSSSSNVKSVNNPVVFNGVSAAWATFGKNSTFPSKSDSVAADVALVAAVDVSPCSAVDASWDAARITSADLAVHARRLVDDADKMVELVKKTRSDTSVPADPGAPPSWAQPYADLSKQFRSELVALDRACPAEWIHW
jgi:hypothetical protein